MHQPHASCRHLPQPRGLGRLRGVHIVHLIARLNDGGPARVIAHLAAESQRRGHRVTVVAGRCDQDEVDISERVRAVGVTVEILPRFARRVDPLSDLSTIVTLTRRLAALRPDVVHTHTAKAGALGRLVCRWLGLPCLHTYHGHVLSGYFSPVTNSVLAAAERWLGTEAHHQALTNSQRHELAEVHGIGRPSRWHTLAIPVAPVWADTHGSWQKELRADLPVVGFLGRLARVKDAHLWLDMLVEVSRHLPVQGLICGEGADRAAIMVRAQSLSVPVLVTGLVPAGAALAAMDVLVMTSRNEGLPLTAVEAAGFHHGESTNSNRLRGVPVVAPPVGGLSDLIAAGLVIGAQRSATALAAACVRVLSDETLRSSHCVRAAILADAYQPSVLAPAYDQLYRAIARC